MGGLFRRLGSILDYLVEGRTQKNVLLLDLMVRIRTACSLQCEGKRKNIAEHIECFLFALRLLENQNKDLHEVCCLQLSARSDVYLHEAPLAPTLPYTQAVCQCAFLSNTELPSARTDREITLEFHGASPCLLGRFPALTEDQTNGTNCWQLHFRRVSSDVSSTVFKIILWALW